MPVRHFRNLRNKVKPWKKAAARRMAKNLTPPEAALWDVLKDKRLGVRFQKQSIILGYICDFFCSSAGLVVEVDGKQHKKVRAKKYDKKRDGVLAKKGIETIRFTAKEVMRNRDGVVDKIKRKIKSRLR